MRGAFAKTLTELAGEDERILLLTGDLGYMALEPFAEKYPDRFLNAGVAEQNMVGVATGLAEAGYLPFVYSIVTFATLRPYEFIRNGPILHQLPVRIVGVGGGFEYGHNGATHYGLEDVGIMRVQPAISVIAPADYRQTKTALEKTYKLPGPIYYRLGKDDQTVVPGLEGRFDFDTVQKIHTGNDILLISMGSATSEVAAAATELEELGVNCTVLVVATLNPAPADELEKYLKDFRNVITVEAHYICGGLGSLVSEVVAARGTNCKVARCSVGSMPNGLTGSQPYLNASFGICKASLVARALELCQKVEKVTSP